MDEIKRRLGIEKANCETCIFLYTECDGNYPEFAIEWPACERFSRYQHLKSFPFKKEMGCWEPEFWHSKYAGWMKYGTHKEMTILIREFVAARDAPHSKYRHMWI